LISWACLCAVVVTMLATARGRRRRLRATLLAGTAGSIFGMQDFLTQRVLVHAGQGPLVLAASWQPWALVAVAITGLTFSQTAFGLADLSASLPALTLSEPVVGIALAAGALGQGFPNEPGAVTFAVGGLAFMVAGVATLTRSPLVVDPHGARGRGTPPGEAVAPGTRHRHGGA
jgi:hypothetical protein